MEGVIDLDRARELKTRLVANIDSLKRSLIDVRKKQKQYATLIADDESPYDHTHLEQEYSNITVNIEQIERVIANEIARSMKCDLDIAAANRVLALHGVECSVGHEGQHDWQISEIFPSGNWKKRRCRRCDTEQRLGP